MSSINKTCHLDINTFAPDELEMFCTSTYCGTSISYFFSKSIYKALNDASDCIKLNNNERFPRQYVFLHMSVYDVLTSHSRKNNINVVIQGKALFKSKDKVCELMLKKNERIFKGKLKKYGKKCKSLINPNKHILVKYKDNPDLFMKICNLLDWKFIDIQPFNSLDISKMSRSEKTRSWKIDIRNMYAELGEYSSYVNVIRCALLSRNECIISLIVVSENGGVLKSSTKLCFSDIFHKINRL